jgi:hypothetical protein
VLTFVRMVCLLAFGWYSIDTMLARWTRRLSSSSLSMSPKLLQSLSCSFCFFPSCRQTLTRLVPSLPHFYRIYNFPGASGGIDLDSFTINEIAASSSSSSFLTSPDAY